MMTADLVPDPLGAPPCEPQRSIGFEEQDPEADIDDEARDPEERGVHEGMVHVRATEHRRKSEDREHQQTANTEQRRRCQASRGGVGIDPGGCEHAELHGGSRGISAGQYIGDEVSRESGRHDGKPPSRSQDDSLDCRSCKRSSPPRREALRPTIPNSVLPASATPRTPPSGWATRHKGRPRSPPERRSDRQHAWHRGAAVLSAPCPPVAANRHLGSWLPTSKVFPPTHPHEGEPANDRREVRREGPLNEDGGRRLVLRDPCSSEGQDEARLCDPHAASGR